MKSKEMSDKAGAFAKGGSGKMAPKMGAQPMTPGTAAPTSFPKASNEMIKGGSARSGNKQGGAAPAEAGKVSSGGRGGDNSFTVKGGGNRMAPFTGAQNARPL